MPKSQWLVDLDVHNPFKCRNLLFLALIMLNSFTLSRNVGEELLQNYYADANKSFKANPDVSGIGIFPGLKFLLSPWATSTYQWFYPRGASTFIDNHLDEITRLYTWMANVTLYPAPGEILSLQFDVADFMFNKHPATISLKVTYHMYMQTLKDSKPTCGCRTYITFSQTLNGCMHW